jgi:hypothetical protein
MADSDWYSKIRRNGLHKEEVLHEPHWWIAMILRSLPGTLMDQIEPESGWLRNSELLKGIT